MPTAVTIPCKDKGMAFCCFLRLLNSLVGRDMPLGLSLVTVAFIQMYVLLEWHSDF
jgi:hypothetical protein